MVDMIKTFRADDGTIFETAFDAWRHELKCWIKRHGCDNEAIASKIANSIADGRPDSISQLRLIVDQLDETQPPPAPVAAPPPPPPVAEVEPDPPTTIKPGSPEWPLISCPDDEPCNHQPGTCTATIDQD